MRHILPSSLLALAVTSIPVLFAQAPAPPRQGSVQELAVTPQDLPQLREWDAQVNALVRTGGLALRNVRSDTVLAGRVHERYDQFVGGVRVFVGDLARQTRDGATTFQAACASCHAQPAPDSRAPNQERLGQLADSSARSNRLIREIYFGPALRVLIKPVRVDRIRERGAGPSDLDFLGRQRHTKGGNRQHRREAST